MKLNSSAVKIGSIVITPQRCIACLLIILAFELLLGLLVARLHESGATEDTWGMGDWALVSWLLLGIALTWICRDLAQMLEFTLTRLSQRSALVSTETHEPISAAQLQATDASVQRQANSSAVWGAGLMFLMVAGLMAAGESSRMRAAERLDVLFVLWRLYGVLAYVCLGFVFGLLLGRAWTYSFLAFRLQREQIEIKIKPGHPDGAGGMKPIGTLFLFQATIVTLPTALIGLWYMLIALAPPTPQWASLKDNYQQLYLGFFFILLAIEVLGFILPMWLFHRDMLAQKMQLFQISDKLSERITQLKASLIEAVDETDQKAIQSELNLANQRHEDIEQLPTWPVSFVLWRRFAIGNALLASPVVAELIIRTIWPRPG